MVTAKLFENVCTLLKDAGIEDREWDADQLFFIVLGRHYRSLDPNASMPEHSCQKIWQLAEKRAAHTPLQYLAGEWDFYNVTLAVGEGVLIPRADTELIVETALALLQGKEKATVYDLCAGTGAIGCAIAHNLPCAQVTAVELSDKALPYLQKNAARYKVSVCEGDVLHFGQKAARESLDLIVSNPPYVTKEEYKSLAPELFFEPKMALVAEENGLCFYKAIAKDWKNALAPGGWLCFEIGCSQGEAVSGILKENGYTEITVVQDFAGLDRCVTGKKLGGEEKSFNCC